MINPQLLAERLVSSLPGKILTLGGRFPNVRSIKFWQKFGQNVPSLRHHEVERVTMAMEL